MTKFTQAQLKRLETQITDLGYLIRYEKGSFKAGHCIVQQNKLVLVNKFATLEGKINSLSEILQAIEMEKPQE